MFDLQLVMFDAEYFRQSLAIISQLIFNF